MGTLNFSKLFSYREQVARSSAWGHHFLFLNLLLSCFIGFVYFYAAPDYSSFLSFTYLLCSWIGQMSFLSCVVYLLLLFPLTFIGSFRLYRILSIIIASLCDLLLLFDVKLYLAAKVHLSMPVLHLMVEDLDFTTGLNYNFMYIAIPAVIALQCLAFKLSNRELYKTRHNYFPLIFCTVAMVSFVSSHGLSAWADASGYRGITAMRNVYPAHYPLTARSFLSNHGFNAVNDEKRNSDTRFVYPLEPLQIDESSASHASLIAIFINGLSYSDLNAEDTPELLSLKKSYHSFEEHYLPYQDRESNFFASSYGIPVQYAPAFKSRNVYPVVREEMFRNEYSIRLIESKEGNTKELTIPQGMRALNFTEVPKDDEVFVKALENTQDNERRTALTLNLNALTQTALSVQKRRNILRTLDQKLSLYLKTLEEKGLLQHSMVVITSACGNPQLGNNSQLYPRQRQHVPFIVIWPDGLKRGVSCQDLTSHFDFAPTVGRELLGIVSDPASYSLGRDLLNPGSRSYLTTQDGNSLILISPRSVSIYKSNGEAYTESGGEYKAITPDLEHLIGATRELNRFIH